MKTIYTGSLLRNSKDVDVINETVDMVVDTESLSALTELSKFQ